MIAVIFEVVPYPDKKNSYLEIAAELAEDLKSIDGFISVERFNSLTNPEKLLSISYWRDEAAIQSWRNLSNHRNAQKKGREELFKHYQLRVASVFRDYGKSDREQVPDDSKHFHN